MLRNPLPGKHKRIYHFHIRKSAGTSANAAFWRLAGKNLQDVGRAPLIVSGKFVFVRHNRDLIKAGHYTFANSHAPFWEFDLPKDTFSFTIFRDPVSRLYSLYRYYHFNFYHKDAHLLDPMNSNAKNGGAWLGKCFSDFLERVPRKHLENQLFMFSNKFDVEEAFSNVQKLSNFYFQDNLPKLANDLQYISGYPVQLMKERSFPYTIGEISAPEHEMAMIKLKSETELYNRLRKLVKTQ